MDACWTAMRYARSMSNRTGYRLTFVTMAAIVAVLLPVGATRAALPKPAPFDACQAVGVTAAKNLIGGPIVNNAPESHENEASPHESSSCMYVGAKNGNLDILLLRAGTTAKGRGSLATLRSSYEKAATAEYGPPATTTAEDATIVAFQARDGSVRQVIAFTNDTTARVTLVSGKARIPQLNALALSLVRTRYGAAPAPPSTSPDIAPCGRRAAHARHHG